ncbi:Protein of unknown function (DUF3231) [Desulfosporosinus acidiphilus SJ4]|uniref:DUF3231 family protein n=1 Tax=Desulfosporosinus acidiphilus (strain DSM 22704 / JCM 16185 / SJ4) TaxID=646529 RepID=I4D0M8_DESAJ|nr:DUF3231 family protein [Desulfosporosinus acidiphilus]AFM39352.1 Protein of unknown function (DUF3231) [Desulfosporosinus acidiphilus SJ4]
MSILEHSSSTISGQVPIEAIQHNIVDIPPTVAEINHLWSTYMAESMACCFQKHIVEMTKDSDYHNVIQSALDLSSKNITSIENIFKSIQHPIPAAFGEKDISPAPKLFDETFWILYTRIMTKYIFQNHYLAYTESTRSDIRQLFYEFIDGSRDIIRKADDVLLAKGVYPKTPPIAVPKKVDFIHDKDYFGSVFGNGRTLNALEISNILAILEFKVLIKALKLGFAQVVTSDEIRKFFNAGAKLAEKHIHVLRSILEKDGIPGPEIIDYRITDSQKPPFSDRLMLFHMTSTISYILTAYGTGLSRIMRKDVVTTYIKLMADILGMAKDGADLLIKNGWLEKIPETVDHRYLTH